MSTPGGNIWVEPLPELDEQRRLLCGRKLWPGSGRISFRRGLGPANTLFVETQPGAWIQRPLTLFHRGPLHVVLRWQRWSRLICSKPITSMPRAPPSMTSARLDTIDHPTCSPPIGYPMPCLPCRARPSLAVPGPLRALIAHIYFHPGANAPAARILPALKCRPLR